MFDKLVRYNTIFFSGALQSVLSWMSYSLLPTKWVVSLLPVPLRGGNCWKPFSCEDMKYLNILAQKDEIEVSFQRFNNLKQYVNKLRYFLIY